MIVWYQASCYSSSKGVSEIGVKQRYIEWARLEGRDPGYHQLRAVVGLQDYPEHTLRWIAWCAVVDGGGEGGASTGVVSGAAALGLCGHDYARPRCDGASFSIPGSVAQARPRGRSSLAYGKLDK